MTDIPNWVRRDGDALLEIEAQARDLAGGPIRRVVADLLRAVLLAWRERIGAPTDVPETPQQRGALAQLRDLIVIRLAGVVTSQATLSIRRDIERATTTGALIGARQAGHPPVGVAALADMAVVRGVVDELDSTMAARLEIGRRLARSAATLPHLQQAIATGASAARSAETTATWATMRAANQAIATQAQAAGGEAMWVAERNACLYCLAQSGEFAGPDGFDPARGLHAPKPLAVWPPGSGLPGPPRHPECRCHLVVYRGHTGPGITLPDALKREAQRSVVIGLALPSESQVARAHAAKHFVDANTGAPKTVLAKTRRELLAGTFTTRAK